MSSYIKKLLWKNTAMEIFNFCVPQIFPCRYYYAENIAYGIPYDDIDFDKVYYAAKKAQISDFMNRQVNIILL